MSNSCIYNGLNCYKQPCGTVVSPDQSCPPAFHSNAAYLRQVAADPSFRVGYSSDPSAYNTDVTLPTLQNTLYNNGCGPLSNSVCGRSPCNKSTCNPSPCDPPCPNITLITTAIERFLVISTSFGLPTTPIPIGATSIPEGSTIVPIKGSKLYNPEVNSGGILYDPATGHYTVPVGGRYIISSTFSFASQDANGIRESYIYKVDAVTRVISLLAADIRNAAEVGVTRITVTTVASMSPGDAIFFAAAQNTGQPIYIFPLNDPANRFIITRMC